MSRSSGLFFPLGTALVLFASPVIATAVVTADDEPAPCGNHGTAVTFAESPSAAAKEASKQEKLVFVLHVSGQFEDPGLT